MPDERHCEHCGAELSRGTRSDARFCSGRCRVAAHRAALSSEPAGSTSSRPGVTIWSERVQAVSAQCPMDDLTVEEVIELRGAAQFLFEYTTGELVVRKHPLDP